MANTALFEYDVIAVAMLAVLIEGFHVTQLLKAALRGAMMHATDHPALFLIVEHSVVTGLFGINNIPVLPTTTQFAVLGNQSVQRTVAWLEQGIPEVIHSLPATLLIDIFEKFAVCGDEFSTGNHTAVLLSTDKISCFHYIKTGRIGKKNEKAEHPKECSAFCGFY